MCPEIMLTFLAGMVDHGMYREFQIKSQILKFHTPALQRSCRDSGLYLEDDEILLCI